VGKVVFMESNDPLQPLTDIEFSANLIAVTSPLSFEPPSVIFDTVRVLPAKITLKITNKDSSAVSFSVLEPPASYIGFKTKKKKLAPGETTEAEVTISKSAPAGEFNTSFTLTSSDKNKTRFTLAVWGVVIPEY